MAAKVFIKIASHGYKEGFREKIETLFQEVEKPR